MFVFSFFAAMTENWKCLQEMQMNENKERELYVPCHISTIYQHWFTVIHAQAMLM